MPKLSRRQINAFLSASACAAATSPLTSSFSIAKGGAAVVIVGGGAGGASAAHAIKRAAPAIDVTLIEPHKIYTSCFFSNLYVGGLRTFESIQHNYDGLRALGINVVHERATQLDTSARTVTTQTGTTHSYDRLIVSPGIALKYDAIENYSEQAAQTMPHAWIAGPQTMLLRKKLEAMPEGGVVVMAVPQNPYRCPPGPYERACMIAHYLKHNKPGSKLIILDAKTKFSKQPAFTAAFTDYYADIIELNLTDELSNNAVVRVNPLEGELETADGRIERADVANVIPPQMAGDIARQSGLADGDWCPIKPANMESAMTSGVYVLGDATTATQMPKSAFSANAQAKVAAADIVAQLGGLTADAPQYRNTCWSALAPDDSIKIGADYAPGELNGVPALVASGSFVSKPGEPASERKATYYESFAWYSNITTDIFAK